MTKKVKIITGISLVGIIGIASIMGIVIGTQQPAVKYKTFLIDKTKYFINGDSRKNPEEVFMWSYAS